MIVLPSIAFGGFSGSAKDVTARHVHGRSILSVRAWPTGQKSNAQVARRTSLARITKSYKSLSSAQMSEWERLAEQSSGQSVFGQAAQISGINLFVRLNANRAMAGEALLMDAPASVSSVPGVVYSRVVMTPQLIMFSGIRHHPLPFKLVVKMSGSVSPGISNGWSKTVVISSELEEDWGEADVTRLYLKTIGIEPTPGQKVFIECYWLDTSSGFTGQVLNDSAVCTGESSYEQRVHFTEESLDPEAEQSVSDFDVDFSTGSPVVEFDSVCLGKDNVTSSYAYLKEDIPDDLTGDCFVLGRGAGQDGNITAQTYQANISKAVGGSPARIMFMHKGGYYVNPTEVFGTGVLF